MSNPRQSAEPPASRPMLHVLLFIVSLAAFAASMTLTAFTMQGSAPATTFPATIPASISASIPAGATMPATTQIAATTTAIIAASQPQPVVEAVQGYTCLVYGWVTIKDGKVAWLANVAFAAVVICFLPRGARKIADGASLMCVMLAVLFLLTEDLTINGDIKKIIAYGPGFYLWIGSMILMWLGFILDPAWKLGIESSPAPAKKKSAAIVKTKQAEAEEPAATPDDWPFFYGKKPHD